LRVALLHPSLGVTGGAERLTLELAEHLATLGHDVDVFTGRYDSSKWGPPESRRATIRLIDAHTDFLDPASLRDWERIGAVLAPTLEPYDAVVAGQFPSNLWWLEAARQNPRLRRVASLWYCHGFVGWDYTAVAERDLLDLRERQAAVAPVNPESRATLAFRLLRERGLGWVATKSARLLLGGPRGGFVAERRRLSQEAALGFTRVLANSQFTADNVRRVFGVEGFACHPGVDFASTQSPPPGDAQVRDGALLLSVARLDDSKNILGILEALALLRGMGRGLRLKHIVVGSGPQEGRLRRFAHAAGLDSVVEFRGELSGTEIEALYRRAGLFVLPCVDEGFGLVFLEAAAQGLPVLGPSRGGPSELIVSGKNGISVDPLDVGALADAIDQATSGAIDLAGLAQAMSETAHREYSVERFVERISAHLDAAVQSVAASRPWESQ